MIEEEAEYKIRILFERYRCSGFNKPVGPAHLKVRWMLSMGLMESATCLGVILSDNIYHYD